MARTNKMGILKKKMQLQKQKKVISAESVSEDFAKREYENPKGNSFKRFLRSGKFVCDTTTAREDCDGFRIRRKPNGGEIEFVQNEQGYGYRRYIKRQSHLKVK